jgi:hypothetical protein
MKWRCMFGHQWRAYAANRADEREAPPIGGLDVVRCWKMDMAHAESVAARLVEIICEQEAEIAALKELVEVQGRNIRRETRAQIADEIRALPILSWGHVDGCPGQWGRRGICKCPMVTMISRDDAARVARGEA